MTCCFLLTFEKSIAFFARAMFRLSARRVVLIALVIVLLLLVILKANLHLHNSDSRLVESISYGRLRRLVESRPSFDLSVEVDAMDTRVNVPEQKSVEKWSYRTEFLSFPFAELLSLIDANRKQESDALMSQWFEINEKHVMRPPLVPINETCKAPPLMIPTLQDCMAVSAQCGFSGIRDKPAKVAHAIQFGFDVDTLEIVLHELDSVVDNFFLIESTSQHRSGGYKKRLIWSEIKYDPRFRRFRDKVVHFIMDDADRPGDTGEFANESLQETLRFQKFLQWNNAHKVFADDDVIGFGDVDEVPARHNVQLMKYCQWTRPSIDVGIWFPFGRINQAFKTDFPVAHGKDFSLGDPTFYTLASAKAAGNPSRRRGRSHSWLAGGIHMTHYGHLPFQNLKHIAQTEAVLSYRKVTEILLSHQTLERENNKGLLQLEDAWGQTPQIHRWRLIPLEKLNDANRIFVYYPWFYECNRARYPVWEGKHDTRLDD